MADAINPLWPKTSWGNNVNIDVFGASGDHATGKTTIGISIAPGTHPKGHPFEGKARTLVMDLEKSSRNYLSAGFDHIDAPPLIEAFARKKNPRGSGYAELDAIMWFIDFVEKIPSGKDGLKRYDVIMADPINDLDDGVAAYVRKNHKDFDLSEAQADGSLIYKGIKKFWKQKLILLSEKCHCFFFTTHLGIVWKGGSPTKERRSKGSSVLSEITALRLTLERPAGINADNKRGIPVYPSAIVNKCRISDNRIVTDQYGFTALETHPLLPPYLPVATITEIRKLIAEPIDYATLGDEYKVPDRPITDEERTAQQIELAEAEERAASAKIELEKIKAAKQKEPKTTTRKSYGKEPEAKVTQAPPPETEVKTESGPDTETEPEAPGTIELPAQNDTALPEPAETSEADPPFECEPPVTQEIEFNRDAFMEIVKASVIRSGNPSGVIAAEEYSEFCTQKKVDKASDLSDADLAELVDRIRKTSELKRLISVAKMPPSKVTETLQKAGASSLFGLDPNLAHSFATRLSEVVGDTTKN